MGRQRDKDRGRPEASTGATKHERFEFVEDDRGGVTVMRDGHPQSHVDIADPTLVEFEYVQHFALALDALLPIAPTALAITHVGGAGLTLARYVEATRPGSPQIVLEPDAELTDAVRRELPLPRGHRIRVRAQDGAAGLRAMKDDSADVIVLDAFADGRVPSELVSPAFAADVARVLKPGGVLLANLADEPGYAWSGRAVATFLRTLPFGLVLGAQEVLKGRRFGNTVLVATADSSTIDVATIRQRAARALFPTGVRVGDELVRLTRGLPPFSDDDTAPSPHPPQLGGWRVR